MYPPFDILSQHALIETAGVVWIGAECAILLLLRAARRHVRLVPPPRTFQWRIIDRRTVIALVLGLIAIAVYAPGRHLIGEPLTDRIERADGSTTATAAELERVYHSATRPHLVVWSAFILTWVVLEIALVWNGIRLYHAVRGIIDAT